MYRYEIERIEREKERREKEIFESVPNDKKGPDKRFVSMMTSMSHTYGNGGCSRLYSMDQRDFAIEQRYYRRYRR